MVYGVFVTREHQEPFYEQIPGIPYDQSFYVVVALPILHDANL